MDNKIIIKINTEYIKLGQVLKLAGITDSGSHSKIIISNGEVKVNEEVELRRGRKIYENDIIKFDSINYIVKYVEED